MCVCQFSAHTHCQCHSASLAQGHSSSWCLQYPHQGKGHPHLQHAVRNDFLLIIVISSKFTRLWLERQLVTDSVQVSVKLVVPSLQEYLPAFVEILGSDQPHNTDHGLRKQVIMTLCNLLRSFTQPLTSHIMSVVTPVWNILTQQTPMFVLSMQHVFNTNLLCFTAIWGP